jgi:hypothetical protein
MKIHTIPPDADQEQRPVPFGFYFDGRLTQPRFRCQMCGELITDANKAILLWNDEDPRLGRYINKRTDRGFFAPVLVCDNGACRNPKLDKLYPLSMELQSALIFLLNNCGMTEDKLQQAREICGYLGQISKSS